VYKQGMFGGFPGLQMICLWQTRLSKISSSPRSCAAREVTLTTLLACLNRSECRSFSRKSRPSSSQLVGLPFESHHDGHAHPGVHHDFLFGTIGFGALYGIATHRSTVPSGSARSSDTASCSSTPVSPPRPGARTLRSISGPARPWRPWHPWPRSYTIH
jgi:hypothetical protein